MSKPTRVKGKFKSIFGRKSNGIDTGSVEEKDGLELVFSREVLSEISKTNSVSNRARALKEFGEIVSAKELEEYAIEGLLNVVDDLLDGSAQTEGRQAALQFLVKLTTSQYEHLGILRSQLFRIIIDHKVEEDLEIRVSLLKVLTDNGKDISYCEQIGAFLVDFMSEALYSPNADEFLMLLVNIVHYNSSFLDKGIISALVCKICQFCDQSDGEQDIEECLSLLDASIRYGGIPSEGIYPLIRTLCRTVNIEKFCQSSWKLMRSLIGTKLGHTAIYFMCQILEDNNNLTNTTLIRGAVFFIGMSIWGSKRVTSLKYDPVHVLPSFKICLQSSNPLVAKEISLSLQRLVKKFGAHHQIITWDVILDIIEILLKLLEHPGSITQNSSLYNNVHAILTNTEQLYMDNNFRGCTKRLFEILASCAKYRSEESVSTLLDYYQEKIKPSNDNWAETFEMVFEEYFRKECRTAIRVKVIHMVTALFSLYRHKYEDDILSITLNKYLADISTEEDKEVRLVTSQLLSDMLHKCSASNYPDILSVIVTLISSITTTTEEERENIRDIEIAIDALIKAFKEKLFVTNNNYVVNIFKILFNHVNQHYIHCITGTAAGLIRKQIFTFLLSVRANELHYIGLMDSEERVKYSAHVIFNPMHHEESAEYMKLWLVDCDFQKAFDTVLKCLKNELDWIVLECVLKHLKWQLQNKNLFVYCQCNMDKLCAALCVLINDKMYLNKVQNCPANMGISELRNLIFPILSVIATYHLYLTRQRQFDLVNCIEFGLNTHCAHTCVSCLSICILEMQHVMVRTLPSVLVKLSQISATVQLAIPVLEFLSTLKEIPTLYVNFVEEQYMSIFAMALSYTDSYRYSSYIVTLAHQIIADWFTRCRLTYRKGFVTLIAKALKSSTMINADREKREGIKESESGNKTKLFHEEMTNVCLDMMARYSFSRCIGPPRRTDVIESLISEGTSQTWLSGNMLITITTCSNIPGHCSSCCVGWERSADSGDDLTRYSEAQTVYEKPNSVESNMDNREYRSDEKTIRSYEYVDSEEPEVRLTNDNTLITDEDCEKRSAAIDVRERCDSAALVSKLTEMLANPDTDLRMFSPSETLLFSRQGSKSANAYNNIGDDHDDLDDSDDDNEGQGVCNEDEEIDDHDQNCGDNIDKDDFEHCDDFNGAGKNKEFNVEIQCDCKENIKENQITSDAIEEDKIEDITPTPASAEITKPTVLNAPISHTSNLEKDNSQQLLLRDNSHSFLQSKSSCKVGDSYGACQCACIGWAEVYIRRPTGNVSWVMEVDNRKDSMASAFPDLSTYVSSLDYLELYKKLSCTMLQDSSRHSQLTESTAGSFSRKSQRRHSTGSLRDFNNPSNSDRNSGSCQTSLFALKGSKIQAILSSKILTSDYGLNISHAKENNKKQNALSASQSKTFPGYASENSSSEVPHKNTINPNFIFLQLFYSSFETADSHPIVLDHNEVIERAMKILDRIPSFNTHKFGVLYVRSGQYDSETAILSNQYGSSRYADFISGLGNVVNLTECNPFDVFTGGLDCRGSDGNFAYLWKDETTQVIFHIATLMPNKENDSNCVSKKMHIGNNFVTIIYDESKRGYPFGTIKGQFNSAEILIRPLEYNSNTVTVRYKEKVEGNYLQPKIISDCNLPILVRQLAIHTNMAVVTELAEKKTTNAFASNWLERLRQIKRIKCKAMTEVARKDTSFKFDFTKFT